MNFPRSRTGPPKLYLIAKLRFEAGALGEFVLLTQVDPETQMLISVDEVHVSEVVDLIHEGHHVRPMFPNHRNREAVSRYTLVGHVDGHESFALEATLNGFMAMDAEQMGDASFAADSSQRAYRSAPVRVPA